MGLNPGWRPGGEGWAEATMILFRDDAVLKHAYMQSGAPLKKARRSGSAGQNALIGRLMMMITSTEGNWPQSLETVSYYLWSL